MHPVAIQRGPPDVADCFDQFASWFAELVERTCPDLVVAIARGAVRLLQLHGVFEQEPRLEIYSHYALPFLTSEQIRGRRVLVFDDSVIYGSTMGDVSKYLTSRGAIVIHAAYVVDESHSASPYAWLRPKVKKVLSDSDVRRHHAALVDRAFHRGLDFNLDFPLITIRLDAIDEAEIPFLISLLKSRQSLQDLHNVTYPVAHRSDVQRWTILHDWSPAPLSSDLFALQANAKTRVTFVPQGSEIHLKPIVQYAIKPGISPRDIHFADSRIESMWQSLTLSLDDADPYRDAALLRILTFFGATLLGCFVASEIRLAFEDHAGITSTNFDRTDATLVLGVELSDQLNELWVKFVGVMQPITAPAPMAASEPLSCGADILRDKLAKCIRIHPEWRPSPSDTVIDSLGKLFLAIQAATDSPEARKEEPGSKRLKVGMNSKAFCNFLETEYGLKLPQKQISLALDYCVDRALAVANVVKNDDGWLLRAFYCGEDTQNQEKAQLSAKLAMAAAQTATSRSAGITPYEIQKICATVSYLCDFFAVEVGPNNYGMTCTVEGEDLIHVLTKGPNPAFVEKIPSENASLVRRRRRSLRPNPAYRPPTKTTWSALDDYRFSEAFKHSRRLFSALNKKDKDAILLLSTCGTAERAFQSIAFEMHGWCGTIANNDRRSRSIRSVISVAESALNEGEAVPRQVLEDFFWSFVRIREAQKKLRIWSTDYQRLKDLVLEVLAKETDVARWWKAMDCDDLLDQATGPQHAAAFATLRPLVRQAELITTYGVLALIEGGAISRRHLESEWRRHNLELQLDPLFVHDNVGKSSVAAGQYNKTVSLYAGHHGIELHSLLCEQAVPGPARLNREWFATAFENLSNCCNEVNQTVLKHFPRLIQNDGRQRFLVGAYRAITEFGESEVPRDDVFILVIGFFEFESDKLPGEIRAALMAKATKLDVKGLFVDPVTGTAQFVACAGHFDPLKTLAASCCDLVAGLDQDYPGSVVQILTFGSVIVGTSREGRHQIRDQLEPCSINAAAEIVVTVRQSERFDRRERLIVVTDCAWERLKHSANGVLYAREIALRDTPDSGSVSLGRVHAVHLSDNVSPECFFCLNSADRSKVEEIKQRVENEGIKVAIDSSELLPGDNWPKRIPELLERVPVVVIFLGSAGLGHVEENELTHASYAKKRLIPVLLPGFTEEKTAPLLLNNSTRADFRNGITDEAVRQLCDGIRKGCTVSEGATAVVGFSRM